VSELIETLASYVSTSIRRRLMADPRPIGAPTTEQFPAAVLFADISGFTALTEYLAQRGPAGAEELTQHLNTYFGQLIQIITSHGGDVVKFAGDALIALFPTLDKDGLPQPAHLPLVTRYAAQCSLVAQRRLNRYKAAADVTLSLKLAVGAGEVITMHLGGERGRWEYLVTGDPLVQVVLAGNQAQPGEVVVSPEAWRFIEPAAAGKPVQLREVTPQAGKIIRLDRIIEPLPLPDVASPVLASDSEAGLRAYIPGAIRARAVGWPSCAG